MASYVLATTTKIVRWYAFDSTKEINKTCFSILDKLDLSVVPCASDKETAKSWAQAMGLKSWRYVKI